MPAITDATNTIWFDDPTSLKPKYEIATNHQLKGVGVYQATDVDYLQNERTENADNMWNALCQRT